MRKTWYKVLDKLGSQPDFYESSAATYRYHQLLVGYIEQYAHGRILDLGCGRQTYRPFLLKNDPSASYTGLDIVVGVNGVDVVGSGARLPFKSDSFDTIFCTQVLEHVPAPWLVAAEMYRVLAPKGHLILTVPFFYFLHDQPYDFYRYTPHGVKSLFEGCGFHLMESTTTGGALGMVSEYLQLGFLVLGFVLSPLWGIFWSGNRLYNRLISPLDERLGKAMKLPINVMVVFQK